MIQGKKPIGKHVFLTIMMLLLGGALVKPSQALLANTGEHGTVHICSISAIAWVLGLLTLWLGVLLLQRRRMTETLRQSQATLNAILQGIDDPITMMDEELKLLWANETAKKLFGEDLVGRKCYETIRGRTKPCEPYPCRTLRAFRDGCSHQEESQIAAPDGEISYYHCSSNVALRDREGKPTAVVEIARDITAIKEAQEELHLAKCANDSSIASIGIADLQGRLTYANKALLSLWGYSSEKEVLGRHVTNFLQNPLAGMTAIGDLRKNGEWHGTLIGKRENGSSFEVEIQAYLTKNPKGDPIALTGYFSDATEKKKAEQKIRRLAYYDSVTGLPNRVLLRDHMGLALGHAQRSGESVAVLLLDLDNFKQVNDTLGHAKGDQLLRKTVARLKSRIRKGDTLARWAGDEFVLLLTGVKTEASAAVFARGLLDLLIEQPFLLDDREIFISASLGISIFPSDGLDNESLLRLADMAMYEAKRRGGNRYHFFSEKLHHRVIERHKMETNLRRGLRSQRFSLVYQPQIDLNLGKVVGVEALVRWQDSEKGLVPPSQFIPVAEETGLILPLGDWILRTACAEAMKWQRTDKQAIRVAVNLSARQLHQPNFVERVEEILESTGLSPHLLEIELTESVFMENMNLAIEVLVDLKARGIRIAIDDFGTGYSSLSYLKNFPIDRIKIAQEFVRDVPADPNDMAIIQATMAMARSLDLQVIAEGVETREQVEFLQNLGCTEMQGYYFARPMAADQVADLSWQEVIQALEEPAELANERTAFRTDDPPTA